MLEWSEQLGAFEGYTVKQLQAASKVAVLNPYSEDEFVRLPQKLRVHLVKLWMRDLEVAAKFADGFVVSGKSTTACSAFIGADRTADSDSASQLHQASAR